MLRELDRKAEAGVGLILPIAAVVETAQHVQRIGNGHERRRCASSLHDRIFETLNKELPGDFIPLTWDESFLTDFFMQTPPYPISLVESLSQASSEAGDLLLISEFRRLRKSFTTSLFDVDAWTHDNGLRAAADSIRETGSF